jgi:hypothetical protein
MMNPVGELPLDMVMTTHDHACSICAAAVLQQRPKTQLCCLHTTVAAVQLLRSAIINAATARARLALLLTCYTWA